ncbi:MAG: hypothetical protein HOF99_08750, partial [Rhodospirillaceae bacterium]|nr:hypothetical protein [Rhodospirillaceae bacterium]
RLADVLTRRLIAILDVFDDRIEGLIELALSADGTKYVSAPSNVPTELADPGLPFSLVFRSEPGTEDTLLNIASSYEAASNRRVPPPAFGAL